ncbi:MAG TPA: trypsin-like peptidase domain-containing protein, partial [Bacillota bacterium]|nr:trypsin-like peptidase domain-containing protein [Bacillota bacterium]
ERSVVQIMTFSQQPDWEAPWRFDPVRRSGGSGFVIKGKRIMTNAHVVSWARQIIVRRYQDPRPYLAEVEYVGHDCDLAVLTVKEDQFFDNLEPLQLGDLPKVRSAVITYGYPAGGEEISYTRGVVSRIELEPYSHIGNRRLLSVQTDAAINPGNSGGPVIQEDKVVGVAFQGMPGLENAGFFIPPPVVEHFLKDIEDKRYDGFPNAGLRVAALQSPAYRAMLKLPDNNMGARVDGIVPNSNSEKVLKTEDVLWRIGSFPVASDGTILYQGNRLSAALALQMAQSGECIPVQLWRDGKLLEVSLPVSVSDEDRAAGYQYDALPRYLVYGGLVFTPLSVDYLRTLGRNTPESSSSEMYYELHYRRHESPATTRPEPIVLSTVLADAVNANVATRGRALVDKINGIRIEKLEDAVRAFETNTNAYDLIQFVPNNSCECLERSEVPKATPRILKTYAISKDRRL